MTQTLRSLFKSPGFTAVAVVTLALGIGANTAIFSVVNGVLLRRLPYPNADRVVQVWRVSPEDQSGAQSAPDFLEFQRSNRTLSALAGFREQPVTIAANTAEQDPVNVTGAQVTSTFFDVLGMPAIAGRTFSQAAGDGSSEPRVILSGRTWRERFASDPTLVGRQVRIDTVPHTVVGIMPDGFDFPLGARAWLISNKPVPLPPMQLEGDLLETRDVSYFNAIGLLRPGVSPAQAQADIGAITADLARRFPRTNATRGARVELLHEGIVGDLRQGLLVLLGGVGVVLLIACANVANLLLARASGRQRELAVRAALGASQGRLARQLLGESLALAALGGLLGLLLGAWALQALIAIMPQGTPRLTEIRLDPTVIAVCLGISLGCAALFGLLPALQASRANASHVLRQSGDRLATGAGRARLRAVLVVGEIALTLVLLVAAALLGTSFLKLQKTDPGFAADRVTIAELALPPGKYADSKSQSAFYERLIEGLRARGEIQMAAVAFPRPFSGSNASGSFFIEGRPAATRAEQPTAAILTVSSDYLRTMGIPLISGRHLTAQDRPPAAASILVNAAFERRYFNGEPAVGRRIRFDDKEDEWLTIVGVAGDTRSASLGTEPAPSLYLPYEYFTLPFLTVVVQSPGGVAAVSPAVRAVVKDIDPELPIDSVRSLADVMHQSVAEPRYRTVLLGAFAVTALLLATIGVYGLIAYSVAQRTREIGIRVALGATAGQVVGPIVREGMLLAATGVALGLVGAYAVTRLVAKLLFGVGATDPVVFAAVSTLLLAVALLASYLPSRRALRVDPLTALRAE